VSRGNRRAVRNYVVDVLLLVLSVLLVVSSALLWLVFPRGFYPQREAWLVVHKYAGLALTVLVLVHLVLHGGWLVRMTQRVLGKSGSEK
jgi:cytochrome b subunit of formate dehydrogenase